MPMEYYATVKKNEEVICRLMRKDSRDVLSNENNEEGVLPPREKSRKGSREVRFCSCRHCKATLRMAKEVRAGVTRGGENWGRGRPEWEGASSPRIRHALKNSGRVWCYLFDSEYTHRSHVFVKVLCRLLPSSGSATQTGSAALAV